MQKISVIIPTYNRKHPLKEALRSVYAQKDADFEVIVIDDGSNDGTREMIASEFPQVRYAYYPNKGPAAARNRGIEMAQNEWLAFLDSDDLWKPNKLKTQIEFFQANPDYLISQTEEIWVRNGQRVNPMKKHRKYHGYIFDKCLALCVISPSAVMLHKRIFDSVGLFDESFPACEDYDLWLRISAKYPVGLIRKMLVVKHGGHPDQRSREFPAMDQFRIRSIMNTIHLGILSDEQLRQAFITLVDKSKIYTQGAVKRGKKAEALKLLDEVEAIGSKMMRANSG